LVIRSDRLPVVWRVAAAATLTLAAALGIVPLYPAWGDGAVALVVLPVLAASMLLGLGAGLVTGALALPATAGAMWLLGSHGWFGLVSPEALPSIVALGTIGGAVGRLRDLRLAVEVERGALRRMIGERQQAEAAWRTSEERLRLIFENTGIGVASLTDEGILEQANPALDEMLRADAGELRRAIEAMARDRRHRIYRELRYRMTDGREAWASLAMTKVRAAGDDREFSIATVENTTVRKVQEEALEHLALHDTLTGLPNRTLLGDRLRQALLATQRERTGLALLIMDLDRFKEVNDSLGHHWGDMLLQQAAARLRESLRDSDTVARLGGDEFAVILPLMDDHKLVERMARKLLQALDRPFVIEGRILRIGASVGAAVSPGHGEDVATMIRHADSAMYAAKRGGRGFAIYSDGADEALAMRLALASELPAALEAGELELHFQPKAEVETGMPVGVEALVRWRHPRLGLLPPDRFIPLAEETGQIRMLGRWVLEKAVDQCARWRALGHELPVAVNLSGRDLHDWELPDFISRLLTKNGVPASLLELEITETAIMTDPEAARELLERIVGMGVSVAIDDFGIGYSSLAQLNKLPVKQLKIDKSFVREMLSDGGSAVIVRSTCDLGHNLGLVVVGEGVEDAETWEMLRRNGCDLAQGFLLSPPITSDDLLEWLRDGARQTQIGVTVAQ
jgi:diguanylate cyclase (GGDEF)-like protein